MLEVLLLHLWPNKCLAVKLTLSDGRKWNIFHKKGDQDQYWKKGIGNIDPPTGLGYRVSIYRKFLLSVVVVIVVDLIQLELLSHFSRDKEKGDQNVLKLAKIEYRISSKNRALISNFSEKDGCLFEGERLIDGALINRTRERLSCF